MRVSARLLAAFAIMATVVGDAANAAASDFQVHGFLTQAYAATDGHQVLGIPRSGTTDYRNLAIQLRYAPSDRNAFAIQMQHERLGLSPSRPSSEVGLDWAFVMHRIGESSEIKIGKTPIPLGIYNELRAVGTVLPFYRVPYGVYREGNLTSEAVDGMVISTATPATHDWRLTLDSYYGGWETLGENGGTSRSRAERALGCQVWLYTPLDNVRLGLEAQRVHVSPEDETSAVRGIVNFRMISLDARPGPLVLQSEYFHADFGPNAFWAAYAHTGINLTPALSAHAQVERSHLEFHVATPAGEMSADRDFYRDVTLGLNYELQFGVLIKGEVHSSRGFDVEDEAPSLFTDPPVKTRYFILSASASF